MRSYRNERVTQVGNQLKQEKRVTWETFGDLLISLFLVLLDRTLFDSMFLGMFKALLSSSKHCFAALALAKITSKGRDLEVEPEVEGRVSGDS